MNDCAETDWQQWQQARWQALSAADGWPGLIGLFWLTPGRNTVGNAPDSTVRLPSGPPLLGHIDWSGETLTWQAVGAAVIAASGPAAGTGSGVGENFLQAETVTGQPVPLRSDAGGNPSLLGYGALRFFVIERDGRQAVRVRDLDWAKRQPLAPLEYFPFRAEWIITARWEVLPEARIIEVPAVTGELKAVNITHLARFEHAGQPVELLPLSVADDGVFFVFRDATSGRLSYGGGRFLKAGPPVDDLIRLDFNRAFNPPCAFSPFATCPLPPPENWLRFAVEAGEKRPSDH